MELRELFQKSELIPVIVQDERSLQVLMLGYTNEEALQKTLETGTAWFWSRSRQRLWNKGDTSGNFLHVRRITADCDLDTLLFTCRPDGPTCHTGRVSCFFNNVTEDSYNG
jgi:phosphoribosyl-AMP cyclohydrolase